LVVLHGHTLPPCTGALPHRVHITITTLHPFAISRQSRTLVSSVSSLLPCCGFRYHWADLYFDRCDVMIASARSSPGLNPRRYRCLAHKGEIWEMKIRDRSS
jgi:hypothetical protein